MMVTQDLLCNRVVTILAYPRHFWPLTYIGRICLVAAKKEDYKINLAILGAFGYYALKTFSDIKSIRDALDQRRRHLYICTPIF